MSALAPSLPRLTATVGTNVERIADGVFVSRAGRDELQHSEAQILTDELRASIRTMLGAAEDVIELIDAAWAMRADEVLNYPSWAEYCFDLFAGIRATKLPLDLRRSIIKMLRLDRSMSNRAIAIPLGLSEGTVRNDLKAIGADAAPATGMDGRTYKARETKAPKPVRQKTDLALESLADAGSTGLTIAELMKKRRWSYAQTSSTLSRLHRQADEHGRRKVECLDERRGGYSVYVHPDHVEGRETKAPGRTRTPAAP